ncbi:type I-B CRISPR-associated protein Cas7/Cst2/DevR [Clostridiales bacterium COT073_COT-073]|nr:type I-B CRISPR-associated protein Cas7/Cst2/DevR [Clostridiales bacterium COT073_COT-073]
MKNKALTLTIIARMTSNYGEGLGNIASVQKVFRDGRTYATRSRESMKNAIMVSSGMYDDLQVQVDGATQKLVNEELNAANCRALEGGYMNTSGQTKIRKSSFYLTDAVACDEFVNETRFHNNLFLAGRFAKDNNLNLQEKAKESGLMPYQYEYDKSMKQYSLTIQLDEVGKDENFNSEADSSEKIARVNAILNAVEALSLVVKGNLDNAEPIFVVGGIGNYKTHYFENVVRVENGHLRITEDLKDKLSRGYQVALLEGGNFANEDSIKEELKPISVSRFFDQLRSEVEEYYAGTTN